jgi:hypothetical protein
MLFLVGGPIKARQEADASIKESIMAASLSTFFILSTWTAVALQFLRLSIDLVQAASAAPSSSGSPSASVAASKNQSSSSLDDPKNDKDGSNEASTVSTALKVDNGGAATAGYGSMTKTDEESQPLVNGGPAVEGSSPLSFLASHHQIILACQIVMAVILLLFATLGLGVAAGGSSARAFTLWAAVWTSVEAVMSLRDASRARYGIFQRILRWLTAVLLGLSATSTKLPYLTMILVVLVFVLAVYDDSYSVKQRQPTSAHTEASSPAAGESGGKLSRQAMLILLKPYVWPDATTNTAFWNRVRAIATWVCVILSKVCNLTSPLMLGNASTALAHQDYNLAVRYSIAYAMISWTGSLLKECQSLVYLRVAQAAFVQLSETVFEHLHLLSLDWHLRKKLGEVLRSMDRGIAACDTLMKYLFLWLVPALAECLVVTIIFATYFKYLPLALSVFSFVFTYIVWTIVVTLWRKKFRKALVKSDNGTFFYDWYRRRRAQRLLLFSLSRMARSFHRQYGQLRDRQIFYRRGVRETAIRGGREQLPDRICSCPGLPFVPKHIAADPVAILYGYCPVTSSVWYSAKNAVLCRNCGMRVRPVGLLPGG